MIDAVSDLLAYLDVSPTPYHAVAESAQRLEKAGYQRLFEGDAWSLDPGDRCYVVRGGGSIAAFEIGADDPARAGLRVIGAHTDSPNLRIRPGADRESEGYRQLTVEPYGGVLLHTWMDRDLSIAGRVVLATDDESDRTRTVLVDFARPLVRVPNLAIHLNRELATDGLKLNPQEHLLPLLGLEGAGSLAELLVEDLERIGESGVEANDILAFDLMTYDTQGATISGANGEFIHSARLDNLASCHAAITALLRAGSNGEGAASRIVILSDHEEVGSRTASGAAGSFLADVCTRIAGSLEMDNESTARMFARSWIASADMAHAVHPNYSGRHDPQHKPVLGGGPVLKTNANQAYATAAPGAARFISCCRSVGVEAQHFTSRADQGCGSTIGPITATRLGVETVDIGNPMLSMHSCREMSGSADVEPMIAVLANWLES
ncbi:MAG: aspartyl aminopeptidase [Hyphomicrobiaceae bacterium]|jgi:aspartyl aminopeptidase